MNWLFKLAYRIALGLIEKQIGYDLEKFGVSTITTCLLLSRKEYMYITREDNPGDALVLKQKYNPEKWRY